MRPRIRVQRAYTPNRSYNNDEGGFRPEGFGSGLQSQGSAQRPYRPRYNAGQQGGYQPRQGGYHQRPDYQQQRPQGYRPRYGNDGDISRVASFCGAGVDGGAVMAAKRNGADVIVSSDVKHNYICDILESGMRLIVLTHYASENYGFKKIYQDLSGKLGIPSWYHEDDFML